MTQRTFVTGFPGFLARHLLARLVVDDQDARFDLLVQASMVERAERVLADAGLTDVANVLVGDITMTRLGLPRRDFERVVAETGAIWHLAALYNLAVPQAVAHKVNVGGTRNVLDVASECAALERLYYVSTCFVAGDRTGLVREVELDEGQGFKNHYESTKFWAEMEVQRRIGSIPTTIFRPSIVVGDRYTGRTDKFDGPYYVIQLLMRLPWAVPVPNLGQGRARVNLTPVDFVTEAMVHIANRADSVGRTFQVADPEPMRSHDVVDEILRHLGRPPAVGRLPPVVVDVLMRSRRVVRALDVPREAVAYFNHDAHFDTSNTDEALADSGIRCPHLTSYLDVLIDYVRRHPGTLAPAVTGVRA